MSGAPFTREYPRRSELPGIGVIGVIKCEYIKLKAQGIQEMDGHSHVPLRPLDDVRLCQLS